MKIKLEFLHEDEALVIVNKPARLLAIPDRFDAKKPNLYHQLKQQFGDIFIVHRLDFETSGIICFAKTPVAHQQLSQQFEARSVEKKYWALLDGVLLHDSGEIEVGIAPHPVQKGRMIASKKGKEAFTSFKKIAQFRRFSLVEANIKTGRTHQIRVHFASIGHPLAIDPFYGKRAEFLLSEIKRKRYNLGKTQEERPLMNRTTLHAYQLTITHPTTEKTLTVNAPLHKDFNAVLNQLSKWDKAQEQ